MHHSDQQILRDNSNRNCNRSCSHDHSLLPGQVTHRCTDWGHLLYPEAPIIGVFWEKFCNQTITPYMPGFISGLSILLQLSMRLFLCQSMLFWFWWIYNKFGDQEVSWFQLCSLHSALPWFLELFCYLHECYSGLFRSCKKCHCNVDRDGIESIDHFG